MPDLSLDHLREFAKFLNTDHNLDAYRDNHRLAAVLIIIYQGQSGLEIILTRRSEQLPTHAGQISFPGGSIDDKDDNPVATALREAEEEISLERSAIEILGILDETLLPSGFAVAPVLGISH